MPAPTPVDPVVEETGREVGEETGPPVDLLVEGVVGLCTQVVDERGVFVVLPAPTSVEVEGAVTTGYLAVWRDAVSEELFVYDRPLFDEFDVGQSVLNLRRDRDVPIETLTSASVLLEGRVAGAESIDEDATLWQPMTRQLLWRLMGYEWSPYEGEDESLGTVALQCPPEPPFAEPGEPGEVDCKGLAATPQEFHARLVVVACGCSGPCCANPCLCNRCLCLDCDDRNPCTGDGCAGGACHHRFLGCSDNDCCSDNDSCTYDYCTNSSCYHVDKSDGEPCLDDGNGCTKDHCITGVCVHPVACMNSGDYCTDEYCSGGACIIGNGTMSCSAHFLVDGEGQPEDYPYTRSACAVLPRGTDCVRVQVYYFSREWPYFTSQPSEFNDTLRHELDVPGQPLEWGSAYVNDLHTLFELGPYTVGSYRVFDRQYRLESATQLESAEIGMRATATNISDANLGSGVAFKIDCDLVDLDVDGVAEEDELEPGGLLNLNSDDDNGNGIPDKDEVGAVVGESDLLAVHLSTTLTGTVELNDQNASGRIKVYAHADRSSPLSLPSYWDAVQLPKTVYVEGVVPSLADGDVALRLRANQSCRDVVNLTVVCPMTVTWEKADPSNAELENDPINGGVRIFPDKLSPGDLTPTIRQQVKLVARVSPAVPGVTVYFKVFDVDDPFDQLNPTMASVSLIDNNTSGPDNRGAEALTLPWTDSEPTGPDGRARVTFTVSMQPGNNYRAGACILQAAVTGATQTRADAADDRYTGPKPGNFEGFSAPLNWSEMLTVWRKLYVETDTMGAPDGSQVSSSLLIDAIGPVTERPGETRILTTLTSMNDSIDLHNYEGGTVSFHNCPIGQDTFIVGRSFPATDFSPLELIIQGMPAACAEVGTGYTLRDDDDPSALGTPAAPRFPRGGQLLFDAFAPAYILPSYVAAEHQSVVPFDPYLNYWEISTGVGAWNNSITFAQDSEPALWTTFVLGAWEGSDSQFELNRDGDADPDECLSPASLPEAYAERETALLGARRPGTRECIVFLQALADELQCLNLLDEQHTFVHEVAHTCGNMPHKEGTIMQEGGSSMLSSFDGEQLRILREQNPW